jgi:hypothetical protein
MTVVLMMHQLQGRNQHVPMAAKKGTTPPRARLHASAQIVREVCATLTVGNVGSARTASFTMLEMKSVKLRALLPAKTENALKGAAESVIWAAHPAKAAMTALLHVPPTAMTKAATLINV